MSGAVVLPGQEIVDVLPPGELAEIGILQPVPVVKVRWADDRETCSLVHDYLAGLIQGQFEEFGSCSGYAAGVCRGTGGAGLLCLFHEPESSPAWQRAKSWERVLMADGTTALQRCP